MTVEPCDLRKEFNGLYAAVTERLGEDPGGGALFVFCNRGRTRLESVLLDVNTNEPARFYRLRKP